MSSRRWGVIAAVVVAVIVGAMVVSSLQPPPRVPPPQTVVLITIDTLRTDAVSFTPGAPKTTPYLGALANRGIIFDEAYAPSSWTPPSMASLMTGVYPKSHGVTQAVFVNGTVTEQHLLPASLLTLAEAFKAAGYVTIGVPANRHLSAELGFGQGFDHYAQADFLVASVVNDDVASELERAFGPDWATTWKQRKTFLWIHYFDPHDPYYAREPWISRYAPDFASNREAYPDGLAMKALKARYPEPDAALARRLRALYESEISYLDHHIHLLDARLGLADDNVLFIMTSDHGEEFLDHGGLGHSTSLYQELVHVPLVVHWPAGLATGIRSPVPVSTVDLYPTIAELAGLSAPSGLQGTSLVPILRGRTMADPPGPYFELDKKRNRARALRDGGWKLIHRLQPRERPQLFNLKADPHERNDVVRRHPKIVKRLVEAMKERAASIPKATDSASRVLEDDSVKEQLRALGYLDP